MPYHSASALDPAHVLVVGDQRDVRALARIALERAGHRVEEAENLARARDILVQGPVELVLCNLRLGAGQSGLDLLRELAPRSPDIAVVMLTEDPDTPAPIECLREGAFDYVGQPFEAEELQAVIVRALRRRQRLIEERRPAEDEIRILSRFSFENPNPVLRLARDGIILFANAAGHAVFGQLNCQVGTMVPPFLGQFVTDVLRTGEPDETQVEVAGRTFSFVITPIKGADYVYLYGHDISRLKATERELIRLKEQAQAMALHDPLTGLPNRTLLEDRLAQAIAQCDRLGRKLAVTFLDLDNFKQINDAHGHQVGDQILVAVGRGVSAAVRKTDTVARWGGDELILLLPGLNAPAQARAACERVKQLVQKELACHPLTGPLTLSMGVAIYPDDAVPPELLLRHADAALYRAKARGRNVIVLFGESPEPQTQGA